MRVKHRHFSLEPTVGLQEAVVQGIKAKKCTIINLNPFKQAYITT